jgi:hypothetical protein
VSMEVLLQYSQSHSLWYSPRGSWSWVCLAILKRLPPLGSVPRPAKYSQLPWLL